VSGALRRLAIFCVRILSPAELMAMLFSAWTRLRLRSCGKSLRLRPSSKVLGHRNIALGDRFTSLGQLYLYAHDGGSLEVGDDCTVNTNVQFGAAGGKIALGNHVMIAANVVLRATNHGMRLDGGPMDQQPITRGEIRIGNDVWIGSNVVITADVNIADGTVVGAGAVVTRSTEPYSIVAGVPARKIGLRS
jgi:galactoside O-acetyltransferase